jgi:farnesyl-diphosphate farnesyltransferase
MGALPDPLPRILTQVSRSFALSLGILPRPLRGPLGIAYLLARAADTIADTRAVPRADRLRALDALRAAVEEEDAARLQEIRDALSGPQRIAAERELLLQLPACTAALAAQSAGDQARIREVLRLLIEGMDTDLRAFPGDDESGLTSLESLADLDRYTYYAAGCVGEFWTDMAIAHLPACAGWDAGEMRRRGMRFGRALQMTNVLRDVPQDLRIGRCYLPRAALARHGLAPADLLDPGASRRLRPLLEALLHRTLADYREAWRYTQAIPRTAPRLRLACAWPMLIGLQTLDRIRRTDRLLDPGVVVKIPRAAVYRILLRSAATVWSNWALGGYYRALERPLASGAAPGALA